MCYSAEDGISDSDIQGTLRPESPATDSVSDQANGGLELRPERGAVVRIPVAMAFGEVVEECPHRTSVVVQRVVESEESQDDLLVLLSRTRRPIEATPIGILCEVSQQIDERPSVHTGSNFLWLQDASASVQAFEHRDDGASVVGRLVLMEDRGVDDGVVEGPAILLREILVGLALQLCTDLGQTELPFPEVPRVERGERQQALLPIHDHQPPGLRLPEQEDSGYR